MAYVPGQQVDLFISYAHLEEAWTAAFVASLRNKVVEKLGAEIDIWKDDKKLRLGQNWVTEIEQGILGAAAFLAVVSPGYRASSWCSRELRQFIGQFNPFDAMKVGKTYRILKVVKTAWENNEHRELLPLLEDILFYTEGNGEDDAEFLPGTPGYDRKVRDCALVIAHLLMEMRRRRERIFIATPTDDCLPDYDALRSELRDLGFDTRPDGLLGPAFADSLIQREVEKARLTVHLLGPKYDAFVEHQIDIAAESGSEMLLWITKNGLQTTDSKQQDLLERLRTGERLAKKFTLLEGSNRRTMIEQVLEALHPSQAQPVAAPVPQRSRVYLLCDPTTSEDATFAAALQSEIVQREKFDVQLPSRDLPTPGASIERHRKLLRDCDGLLVYRDAAPADWLWQTTPEVLFAEKQLSRPPMKSKAFLLNDPNILTGFNLQNVIWHSPKFTVNDLEPFLKPLRQPDKQATGSSCRRF
jgi:hypothetical protein